MDVANKVPSNPAFKGCMERKVCVRAGVAGWELFPEFSQEWELDCPAQRQILPHSLPCNQICLQCLSLSCTGHMVSAGGTPHPSPFPLTPGITLAVAPAPCSPLDHPQTGDVFFPAFPTGWWSHGSPDVAHTTQEPLLAHTRPGFTPRWELLG